MKKKLSVILLMLCSIGVVVAAIADLTGKWTGVVKGPDGNDYPLTYNFKVDGDKLTGTSETSFGTASIDNGKITGNEFSFSVTLNGMEVQQKGKFYTDSVGLNIDYNGTPLHVLLKRADK